MNFFMFLNYIDVLILKIIFFLKKYFNILKKHFKKQLLSYF